MTLQTEAYDSMIECPLCRDEGVVTLSGRVPHLFVDLNREPPMSCPGVHGAISDDVLVQHGIDPLPPRDAESGLAPSLAKDADADHPDHARQDPPAGPPEDVSDLEQQSAYRDAPAGDVVREDHTDGSSPSP